MLILTATNKIYIIGAGYLRKNRVSQRNGESDAIRTASTRREDMLWNNE